MVDRIHQKRYHLAQEAYRTHCEALGLQLDWGRNGFKVEVGVWLAVAATVLLENERYTDHSDLVK
jgi:hypothetical protein